MASDIFSNGARDAAPRDRDFEYREICFTLSVYTHGADLLLPHVLYTSGLPGIERIALPEDSDPYASAAEA